MTRLVRDVTVHDEPADRLGRIGQAMLDAMHAHPEYLDNDNVVICLGDAGDKGTMIAEYEDVPRMMADMLANVQAMAKGFKLRVDVMTMDGDGVERYDG